MNIPKRTLVLSSIAVAILLIMSFSVPDVQASDKIHFTHRGIKGKIPNVDESFVSKAGHRKLSSTRIDGHVSHHQENVGEYCKFLKSIGKTCPK
jgi:hypothetical protein